jgi:hypothetical protein
MNKDNVEDDELDKNIKPGTPGIVDIAIMDVNCHVIIRDIDTKEILLNQRG